MRFLQRRPYSVLVGGGDFFDIRIYWQMIRCLASLRIADFC
jgi:hypothetical protein